VARFTGKRVIVTGAASGMGRRIGERFMHEGAEVVGLDRLPDADAPFCMIQLDIADADAVETISQRLMAEHATLDILVNAAGILPLGTSENISVADWNACFDTNVHGPFYLLKYWLPVFRRQGYGAIVNIASNAAHVPRLNMAAYGASKAALVSLSHCVALELAPYGVRCNVVSPGSTQTPMLDSMLQTPADVQRLIDGSPEQFKLGIPLRKIGTPDDIADVVLFLASDQAGHVTMQDIAIGPIRADVRTTGKRA